MAQKKEHPHEVYSKIERSDALNSEFDSLRSSRRKPLGTFVSYIFFLFLFAYFFPQTFEQPIIYILLILMMGINLQIFLESERINKRIDILRQLVKEEN